MPTVYDRKNKKEVQVKNLKNVTFSCAPGYQFFVHKAIGFNGYTLTEKISGVAVIANGATPKSVIEWAERLLKKVGKVELDKAVAHAILEKYGLIKEGTVLKETK